MKKTILIIVLLFSISLNSQTHLGYYFDNSEKFDQTIPKPSEVIGHEVGEWHVTHDKLVQYMYAIANSSDRVIIEETGKTYENRPLLILKVSSPDNLKNLEKIKENHIKINQWKKN